MPGRGRGGGQQRKLWGWGEQKMTFKQKCKGRERVMQIRLSNDIYILFRTKVLWNKAKRKRNKSPALLQGALKAGEFLEYLFSFVCFNRNKLVTSESRHHVLASASNYIWNDFTGRERTDLFWIDTSGFRGGKVVWLHPPLTVPHMCKELSEFTSWLAPPLFTPPHFPVPNSVTGGKWGL